MIFQASNSMQFLMKKDEFTLCDVSVSMVTECVSASMYVI